MIVPGLRGYRPNLAGGILLVGCRRCRKPWVIYERIGAKAQRRFPMICLGCGRRIVVRLVVEAGRRRGSDMTRQVRRPTGVLQHHRSCPCERVLNPIAMGGSCQCPTGWPKRRTRR